MEVPRASVIIVNTNELHHLKRCLPSVLEQDYGNYEVLVVDNASTDGSVAHVAREFPQIKLIQNQENLGYVGANNIGFANASGDYFVVLNPDTVVEPTWLRELVGTLHASPSAGLATSKILIMQDPERINACGNQITYAGLTVCRGLGQPADRYDQVEIVSAVSGASFAVKKAVIDQIGCFDESLFIYYEDTELSLRAALAGYDCLYVPTSVVYHDYAFRFSAWKGFLQERNRLLTWLKTFRWGTLLALLPPLLLAEVMAWVFSGLKGREHLRSKAQSYGWLVKNRHQIARWRGQSQALRQVGDRQMLRKLGHELTFAGTTSQSLARILEPIIQSFLWVWGQLCRAVVVW